MTVETAKTKDVIFVEYATNAEHLHDELERLDKVLVIKILEFRRRMDHEEGYIKSQPGFVSNEEVSWLMSSDAHIETSHDADSDYEKHYAELSIIENNIEGRINASIRSGLFLPLVFISHTLNLSRLEYFSIIICLAPELRRRYDRIYSYLQDDITRKKPSIDLILHLSCSTESERWSARQLINDESCLSKLGFINKIKDHYSPSGSSNLASFLSLDKRLLDFLLGINSGNPSLDCYINTESTTNLSSLVLANEKQYEKLDRIIKGQAEKRNHPLMIHLSGREGTGKKTLILQLIKHFSDSMIVVDMRLFVDLDTDGYIDNIKNILRESILSQSPVYFENIDALTENDTKIRFLLQLLKEYNWVYFSASNNVTTSFRGCRDILIENVWVQYPSIELRFKIWNNYIINLNITLDDIDILKSISDKFTLSPLDIKQICQSLAMESVVSDRMLIRKCQEHSNHNLVRLATKIPPGYNWDDIVLPEDTKSILRKVCKQVNHKYTVFHEWGFGDKIRYGRGLSVMFCGSPGTGKTLGAQVLASELNLDLYKIDLSNVVSKYIGETEKNLNQVFLEAETSNAILFFDECDALFGKRTEVSDSHDRYANLEVSFLLQKMEEYDGIVILATNLRGNMDDAFIRRIRFIIEFPFPDAESRKLIWEKSFPEKAPCSNDINFSLLAKKLKLSGGNIKNIVLNSAFLASDDGATIKMEHIVESAKDEYKKIGKSWNEKFLTPDNITRVST